jgi:hypothetical protein
VGELKGDPGSFLIGLDVHSATEVANSLAHTPDSDAGASRLNFSEFLRWYPLAFI